MAKKIAIIGGGVAGLSAGIYGQMNGFDTEIFEMHTVPGGQCTAWERKGYRFDYCLHWLVGTAKGVFHPLWKETNVINDQTTIIDHDIYARITGETGDEFIIYTNINRWERYLINKFAIDASAIRKMCKHMRKASRFEPFGMDTGLRATVKKIGQLIRMAPLFPLLAKYTRKTCEEYFQTLGLKDPRLIHFLNSLFGNQNFSALVFIMMLGWFNEKNAGYIIGGSLPLARRMEERYTALGGRLNTGSRIDKIIVEDHAATGVQLSDGTLIKSDYVISAADGYSTIFRMLEGNYVSDNIKNAYDTWDVFTPLVQVSFGLNNSLYSDGPIQRTLMPGKSIGSTKVKNGYSIMNYAFDPTMAPEGKSVVVLRFESPWEQWEGMEKAAYKSEKEKIKTDATAILELHYPGISGKIEVVDVATPLTTVKYTGVWKGAYEGFMPAPGNISVTLKNALPGLNNFYMAGQWLYPGGGLPPSVSSGKKAIIQICKSERKSFNVI
jgi:phytoene dehydrogenase-like protein